MTETETTGDRWIRYIQQRILSGYMMMAAIETIERRKEQP